MDGLCLKTTAPGIHGISSTISAAAALDIRTSPSPSQVSAIGLASASGIDKSTATAVQKSTTPFSRFSLKHPLKFLWPGAARGGGPAYNGMALDDAVPLPSKEEEEAEAEEERQSATRASDDQSGNWVLKILHVRSLSTQERGTAGGQEWRRCRAAQGRWKNRGG